MIVFRPPLIAGLLLWLSFPPIGFSFLAWFALVPLAILIRQPWPSRQTGDPVTGGSESVASHWPPRFMPIYRPAWVGGLVFGLLAVQWIRYADDTGLTGFYGWWALAFYMSLYFPLFLFIARIAVLRFRVPIMIAFPTVWVGLEHLRSWLISGFPWYFLAHTQYRSIGLIQIADIAGAYGVSFLVALVNGWIVDLLAVPLLKDTGSRLAPQQVWRACLTCAAITGSLAYGTLRLKEAEDRPGPRVAIMQSSIPQRIKEDEDQIPKIHQSYWKQLAEASPENPRLVIWPETAYRYPLPIIGPEVTDEDLRSAMPQADIEPAEIREFARQVKQNLVLYAERSGAAQLMGINTEVFESGGTRRFNSAFLISPNGDLSVPYNKIHLVPWGEYLPLRDIMPWLRVFTPHASADYGLEAGTQPLRFTLGEWSFGILICFEDTLPWAARAYVQSEPVDFLVNISNDGWFGVLAEGEAEAGFWRRAEHEAHLGISVFRAVECRRPLLRAVNTGISAMIDSSGRIVRSSASVKDRSELTSHVIVVDVPLDGRRSPYSRVGDWLGIVTFSLSVLTVVSRILMAAFRAKPPLNRAPRD